MSDAIKCGFLQSQILKIWNLYVFTQVIEICWVFECRQLDRNIWQYPLSKCHNEWNRIANRVLCNDSHASKPSRL